MPAFSKFADNSERTYNICEFDDGKLGILPDPWLLEDGVSCKYPSGSTYNLNTTTEFSAVKENWPVYKIKKFYKQNIKTFSDAKEAFKNIETDLSDIEQVNQSNNESSKRHSLPAFPEQVSAQNKNPSKRQIPPVLPIKRSGDDLSEKPGKSRVKKPKSDRNKSSSSEQFKLSASSKETVAGGAEIQLINEDSDSTADQNKNRESTSTDTAVETVSGEKADETIHKKINSNNTISNPSGASSAAVANVQRKNDEPDLTIDEALKKLISLGVVNNGLLHDILKKLEPDTNTSRRSQQAPDCDDDSDSDQDLLSLCPFKSIEMFRKFDAKLGKSKSMRSKLRNELKNVLMDERATSCRALAGRVLDDTIVQCFTFKGRPTKNQKQQKSAFIDTKLSSIIYQVVNTKFEKTEAGKMTEKQYQTALETWLTQAKFRLEDRERRRLSNAQKAKEAEDARRDAAEQNVSSSDSEAGH